MSTIKASQLKPGTFMAVRGKVSFCRIASFIDGEELKRSDERKVANGGIATGRAHTTLTLTVPEVVPMTPGVTTNEEIYIASKFYSNKKTNTLQYSITSTGNKLPTVVVRNAVGTYAGDVTQLSLENELASDVEVTLVLRVYNTKHVNKGVALDMVIIEEEPRYRDSSSGVAAASALGFSMTPLPKEEIEAAQQQAQLNAASNENQSAQDAISEASAPEAPNALPTGNGFAPVTGEVPFPGANAGYQPTGGIRHDLNSDVKFGN